MTFEARELSAELGAPILLATFALGAKTWRFARADQDVTHDGNTYLAVGSLKGSRMAESNETRKNDVTLTVDRLFPIAELWRVSPPTSTVAVILTEVHDDEAEGSVAWLGHVANVSWNDKAQAILTLSPGAMAMKANGLRRAWQVGCPHVFGGPKCLKPLADVEHAVTIDSVDGLVLTSAGFATAGKLAGGFIAWTDAEGVTDRRFLVSHTPGATTATMMTPAPLLAAGTAVLAYEGCDHTAARCVELANLDHHGGLPHFVKRNPFDGQPVF